MADYFFTKHDKDRNKNNLNAIEEFIDMSLEKNQAVTVSVKNTKNLTGAERQKAFFFVQVGYLTAQDMETMEFSNEDYEFRRQWAMQQFLPQVKKDYTVCKEVKTISVQKTLSNSTAKEIEKLNENLKNFMESNGYHTADKTDYADKMEKNKKEFGVEKVAEQKTKEYFKAELQAIINSTKEENELSA